MDGTYIGVVDRIVDGETAVILLEDDNEVVEQFDIGVGELPAEAGEGAVCSITVTDGKIQSMAYRANKTASRQKRAQDRFDRLSKRLSEE